VMNAELGPIGEEELAVVERSSDGGMNASDRILEDPQAVAKAAKAEGAEKKDGDDPDSGGERGGSPTGLRLAADVSAQRRRASFRAFTRMNRPESKEAPSSRTSARRKAMNARAMSSTWMRGRHGVPSLLIRMRPSAKACAERLLTTRSSRRFGDSP